MVFGARGVRVQEVLCIIREQRGQFSDGTWRREGFILNAQTSQVIHTGSINSQISYSWHRSWTPPLGCFGSAPLDRWGTWGRRRGGRSPSPAVRGWCFWRTPAGARWSSWFPLSGALPPRLHCGTSPSHVWEREKTRTRLGDRGSALVSASLRTKRKRQKKEESHRSGPSSSAQKKTEIFCSEALPGCSDRWPDAPRQYQKRILASPPPSVLLHLLFLAERRCSLASAFENELRCFV